MSSADAERSAVPGPPQVDILVNNAGLALGVAPVTEIRIEVHGTSNKSLCSSKARTYVHDPRIIQSKQHISQVSVVHCTGAGHIAWQPQRTPCSRHLWQICPLSNTHNLIRGWLSEGLRAQGGKTHRLRHGCLRMLEGQRRRSGMRILRAMPLGFFDDYERILSSTAVMLFPARVETSAAMGW